MIADGAGRAIAFRIAPGQPSAAHPFLLRRSWPLTGSAHMVTLCRVLCLQLPPHMAGFQMRSETSLFA